MTEISGVLRPKETGRLIGETSKDVTIKTDGVQKVAKLLQNCVKNDGYNIKTWKEHVLNPKSMDKTAIDWIFIADTLNFSFWSEDDDNKFEVEYKGKRETGYWSLAAALCRAVDEGIHITDPSYYSTISREQLAHVLRSDSSCDIPLFDERLDILHKSGKKLMQKYNGSFMNCIKQSEKSAQSLLKLVVDDFPSYRDEAEYNGKNVAFYKRAQILIADIWACCEGKGHGEFHDIDTITMFADYRIPQALVHFGALEYSSELMEYLKKKKPLKSGDRYELEIRGCSIWATELINEEARKLLDEDEATKGALMNSIMADHFLWDYRRDHADEMMDIPYHKVRCIYY